MNTTQPRFPAFPVSHLPALLLAVVWFTVSSGIKAAEPVALFNGKDLAGWTITDFAGHGEISVTDGELRINAGDPLSGVTWTNAFPKMNFEIELDAKKIDGGDFFCAMTCPFGEGAFTFVAGGWGGGVVGISSIDGMDASENETTKFREFKKGQWYHLKLRVVPDRIEAWIDKDPVINIEIVDQQVALRPGEIYLNQPFGFASFQTDTALKNITLRRLPHPATVPKIVFIAGKKSHGPDEHEYEKGLRLLQESLDRSPNVTNVYCEVHTDGWPLDESTLDDASAIVLFSDGSDRDLAAHPLLRSNRLATIERHMKRGAGLAVIHYTVFVPSKGAGDKFLEWVGGYFDYESGTAANKWFSKIETRTYQALLSTPGHPIARGVKPFEVREEYYFNQRFRESDTRRVPLVSFSADKADASSVVGWAVERADGGRGFAYTGGHFHKNWANENARRLVLNAILWTARANVPDGGVQWPQRR